MKRLLSLALMCLCLNLYSSDKDDDRTKNFLQAWNLINKEHKYAEAVKILDNNILKNNDHPGIDYDYAWSMHCHSILGNYQKAAEYYSIIRTKFNDGMKSKGEFTHYWYDFTYMTRILVTLSNNERAKEIIQKADVIANKNYDQVLTKKDLVKLDNSYKPDDHHKNLRLMQLIQIQKIKIK